MSTLRRDPEDLLAICRELDRVADVEHLDQPGAMAVARLRAPGETA